MRKLPIGFACAPEFFAPGPVSLRPLEAEISRVKESLRTNLLLVTGVSEKIAVGGGQYWPLARSEIPTANRRSACVCVKFTDACLSSESQIKIFALEGPLSGPTQNRHRSVRALFKHLLAHSPKKVRKNCRPSGQNRCPSPDVVAWNAKERRVTLLFTKTPPPY